MADQPQPGLLYPKSGAIFLLSEVQRLTANVSDLVDACVRKDQRIAELEAEVAKLQTPSPAPPNLQVVSADRTD